MFGWLGYVLPRCCRSSTQRFNRQVQSYQFYRVKAQGIDPDPDFRESLQSWPADVNALMNDYSSRFWESCSEEEEVAETLECLVYNPWDHILRLFLFV